MNDQINVGDIVFSKTHKVKGKVVKVKLYDKSVLVEVIIAFDPNEGIRTTKLHSFAMSDVRLYKFDHKKNRRKPNEKVEHKETENGNLIEKANELFKNPLPKEFISKDVLKNLEETMKLNRFITVPEINIPEIKKGD